MPGAALVTTTSPVPGDLGKKVVLHGIVEYLVDRLGGDDVHFVLLAPPSAAVPALPCHVHVVRAPRGFEQARAAAAGLLGRPHRSLQEAVIAAPRVATELGALLGALRADVEVFDTIRVGQFAGAGEHAGRRVLHLGDLFSVRYERWLAAIDAGMRSDAQPLGEFATMLPRPLRAPVGHWRIYRAALELERRLVARREAELVRRFDRTTLVSDEEAESLRRRTGCGTVVAIPPAVPGPDVVTRRPDGRTRFLFLGHLGVPHNADALAHLLAAGPERLFRGCPDAELTIVGRGASHELRTLASTWGTAAALRDFVEDLAPLMDRSTALLAPLRWGSGVKLKVLVALAHGCPVLCSSIAAQGIVPTTSTEGVIVEDDLATWPDHVRRLAEGPSNAVHSATARRLWRERWAPAAAFGAYDEVFGLGAVV